MQEAPRVFISYLKKDQAFVRRLSEDLAAGGCVVQSDMNLRIGEDFERALRNMRENARFIIAVMTREYFQSAWAEREWQSALEREEFREARGSSSGPLPGL